MGYGKKLMLPGAAPYWQISIALNDVAALFSSLAV